MQVLKNTLLLLLVFSILDLIYTIFYYYTIISYDISFYWTYNWAIYQGWDILMLPFIIMWCYIWRVNTNSYLLLNQDNERFEETKCEDMQQIEITEINNV